MRFGLFGTGHWAAVTQGAALAAHPAVDLVGVWGRDPAKAAAVAAQHRTSGAGTRAYDDIDALLADVDAVAIALPPAVQAPIAVRAAAAGRHLLLDKPLALTVPAADEVVEAVQRAGVASVVFFTGRFVPSVADFLADATQREWDGARFVMRGSIYQPGSPYASSAWRHEKGGLWDVGPHALGMALPVLGPARDVVAVSGRRETTYVLVRHESGAVSELELSLNAPPEAMRFQSEFYSGRGTVEVPAADATPVEAFTVALDQLMATAAAGSTSHPCDVRFAREVVAILARAELAAGLGAALA